MVAIGYIIIKEREKKRRKENKDGNGGNGKI
jgi:hypothetical protein